MNKKEWQGAYVAHDCRNARNKTCNNRWIDKDLTKPSTKAPSWKFCRECCKKLGIDFDKQQPSDYMSNEEIEQRKKLSSRGA